MDTKASDTASTSSSHDSSTDDSTSHGDFEVNMSDWNSDIVLNVISYLSVIDSNLFSLTNRRHYYLVDKYRNWKGTELVSSISSYNRGSSTTTPTTTTDTKDVLPSNDQDDVMNMNGDGLEAITVTVVDDQLNPNQVCTEAIRQIQTRPNLCIAFMNDESHLHTRLPSRNPHDAIVFGARSADIQSAGLCRGGVAGIDKAHIHRMMADKNKEGEQSSTIGSSCNTEYTTTLLDDCCPLYNAECESHSSLFLANMKDAVITPFILNPEQLVNRSAIAAKEVAKSLLSRPHPLSQHNNRQLCAQDYKMFIILSSGDIGSSESDPFVKVLQRHFPQSTIVGGVCSTAYVSMPVSETPLVQFNHAKDLIRNYSLKELIDLFYALGGCHSVDKTTLRKIDCTAMAGPKTNTTASTSYICKVELAEIVHKLIQTQLYCLRSTTDGICGIALAGNVPVFSLVSRGVVSRTVPKVPTTTTPNLTTPSLASTTAALLAGTNGMTNLDLTSSTRTSSLYVTEAEYVSPGDARYIFTGEHLPAYHLIHRIHDVVTNRSYTPSELYQQFGPSDFLGVRKNPLRDVGFSLETPHPFSYELNAFLLIAEHDELEEGDACGPAADNKNIRSLIGANIDLYDLDGEECMKDVDDAMVCLKEQCIGKDILGCIMFSCSGRGPKPGPMISTPMADACKFIGTFPDVPFIGFYAGGEIGPLALANSRQRIVNATTPSTSTTTSNSNGYYGNGEQSQSNNNNSNTVFATGNACLQGFTVVFALFIVPVAEHNIMSKRHPDIDDCQRNVEEFIQEKLHRKVEQQ